MINSKLAMAVTKLPPRLKVKNGLITAVLTVISTSLISTGGWVQANAPFNDFAIGSTEELGLAVPSSLQTRAQTSWQPRLQSAPGTVIYVTTTQDELNNDGDCSLREAIEAANLDQPVDACPAGLGKDTVVVPKGTYRLSISGVEEDGNKTGDLDILDDLVLVGKGARRTVIDGDRLDRILHVQPERTAEVKRVTIKGGFIEDSAGGGILNEGTLTLSDSSVRENQIISSRRFGGAGLSNAALKSDATMTVNNCLVTRNSAPTSAGISNAVGAGHKAQTTVNDSIIKDNTAVTYTGGGLFNGFFVDARDAESILSINNSLIEGNTSLVNSSGGGITNGGDPLNNVHTVLTVENSRIHGNSVIAGVDGYGVGGGLFASNSTLTVRNSTIDGNTAICEGLFRCGAGGGLLVRQSVNTRIEATTISHNTVSSDAIGGVGGGVFLLTGPVAFVNSTVSGNEMKGSEDPSVSNNGLGGGIAVLAPFGPTTLDLVNTTIAANRASVAGGGLAAINQAGVTINFVNSLFGGNQAPEGASCFNQESSLLKSLGNNLEDDDLCYFDADTDLSMTDPVIGGLADNGGSTQTHALLPDSPALNAGNDIAAPETDQRGVPRPQGPASDIGAYEAEAMYVAGMQMNYRRGDDDDKGGLLESRIRIRAQEGGPVPEATVHVNWTLPDGTSYEQQDDTNPGGRARFALKPTGTGVYEICVDDVRKEGWVYDPEQNRESCETLMVRSVGDDDDDDDHGVGNRNHEQDD